MNYSMMYLGIMLLIYAIIFVNVVFLMIDATKFFVKLSDAINPKQDIGFKFIWCGNPMKIHTNAIYYGYKFTFGLAAALIGFLILQGIYIKIIVSIVLFLVFYNVPNVILYINKKKRENELSSAIPLYLNAITNYNPYDFPSFELYVNQTINLASGILRKEIAHFLSSYLDSQDFELEIKTMTKRLNCQNGVSLELKFRELYYQGVYQPINHVLLSSQRDALSYDKNNIFISICLNASIILTFAVLLIANFKF